MKLMTFNILNGGIDENGSRLGLIKKVIKDASPDFLALQEATNFEKDNYKLLRQVSRDAGLQYYALSHMSGYKTAVLVLHRLIQTILSTRSRRELIIFLSRPT